MSTAINCCRCPPLEYFLYWHANVDADPASQWFRGLVLALMRR
jgi:hypothetical protein